MSSAKEINELFKRLKLTLGSVESFTGGKFASAITSVPGASALFKGALVTYSNSEKIKLLGIDPRFIKEYGACSKETAYLMADNGKDVLDVDVCVSFTGNAGPLPMEGRPVGEVFIGFAYLDEVFIGFAYLDEVEVYKYRFSGTRKEIQKYAIRYAYLILKRRILKNFKNFEKI